MSTRCRAGDMAVIARCPGFPENIGAVVDVLFALDPDEDGAVWQVRSRGRLLNGVRLVDWIHLEASAMEGSCNDAYLMPIRDADGVDEVLRLAGRPEETPCEVMEGVTT